MAEYNEMSDEVLRERTRALLEEAHPEKCDSVTFRRAQYEHGLAWVHFPEGYGGLGLNPRMNVVVYDEITKHSKVVHHDPGEAIIGIGMGAPVVLTYGTDEMKKRLLPKIFSGEEIWCQLFSEPGAGSDVAGLATSAVRDGDDWILNGQKVWTTLAHISRWGMLIARTDPDVPKHDGLSYFILDMRAPGVEIRPLYQITGEAEFNEVFMTDVRIPNSHMLGKEGQGWRVAITTLMNERVAIGGGGSKKKGGGSAPLIKLWKDRKPGARSAAQEAILRDKVTRCYIENELLRMTSQRARAAQKSGNPGPEGSVSKLAHAESLKRMWEVAMDVMGSDALAFEHGYELRRSTPGIDTPRGLAKYQFLRSRANSIEGGTSEIMRNILGERVLGLPGEPRVDKTVPWKDVPRS
ncbi:MAG: acyl-CoA dehydrogenase family protein [Deltaproteobacteria bacterium]|nr:acyl-CoA dehydrogenase family protein [Deltaproteobacteria bacterium]MBW2384200.1 acyl-CoA dehydrogenase family protein [Deltaproteobacteria bacterium]MBW2695364.1 acyl-CoA dehydrogenase family protein [Deltaproteobacteria bacterium]